MLLSFYFLCSFVLIIVYVALIYSIYNQWTNSKEFVLPNNFSPTINLTVVVAARNEEHHISNCVWSILKNDYPNDLFELIVVNDHSDDKTAIELEGINHPNLKILDQQQGRHGKKQALEYAFANGQGEVIVTTDADCIVGPNWLKAIAYHFANSQIDFAAMPVCFNEGTNLIERFQVLDLCGMMAITNHGISQQKYYLANGANMAFRQNVFEEVDGFEGNDQYASGDDMFLIQKMAKRDQSKVAFLRSQALIVNTQAVPTFSALINQRKRWATKSRGYSDLNLQLILGFVFIFNAILVFNLLIGPFFMGALFFIGLLQLFVKMIMDYLFLNNMTQYFNRGDDLKSFFPASVLAIGNILYSGFAAIFSKKYEWKGRTQK